MTTIRNKVISFKEIFNRAQREGYAVGAFGACNLEMVQAIVGAAEAENSPVIISSLPEDIKHVGTEYFSAMVRMLKENASIPIILHLDHGTNFEECSEALRYGFDSVMIDGANLSYEENIKLTKKIVEMAHAKGSAVEAELGSLSLGEDGRIQEEMLTDPEEAKEFTILTGIDALAIAVGNVHGGSQNKPAMDLERLKKIKHKIKKPLVLHGGSGISNDEYQKVIKIGICKINVTTDVKRSFLKGMRELIGSGTDYVEPREILDAGRNAIQKTVISKIRAFRSSDRY